MKVLDEFATDEEIQDFLLYHMDNADDRQSKINPVLTKEQVWNISMQTVIGGDITRVRSIVIKNITREFGKYYE